MFRSNKFGNEAGIGTVALVATKLLVSVCFDLARIDQVQGVQIEIVKGFRSGFGVVPGLLKAGNCGGRDGDSGDPMCELNDARLGVVKSL